MVPVAMPGIGGRQRLAPRRLPHRGTERKRALADVARHGSDGFAGRDDDDRQDQQGQRQGAAEDDAGVLEPDQRHHRDGEQAVDDRRAPRRGSAG